MIIKCKMCGGDLRIEEGTTVAECEYCGTKQTVPNADNEKKIKLFERANRLRAACEFDKAAGVYESIVADFDTEAEAYWGLILCKFGIEYVDDPATGDKVPTCHRSSFNSVLEDPNFELVMENSDAISRKVYRDEAKAIEELRRSIIEVSSKEEPYDVFISYKELDTSGERTIDSVIAQDIYKELTNEGYRVFFSRISLESKLGVEYEPYIFAALNSARVMIVVGTDYDNFNAVWVKNEWSRYLALIASGQKKTLIPCFKNIDAYDMPREFNKLAAQDMGKVGAMQDLLRGVEKLLGKNEGSAAAHADSKSAAEPLLTRAFMFLEDGNWKEADKYCEKVLDLEPKNAQAYLGKLMAECEVCRKEALKDCRKPFADSNNFKKALRFGDKQLVEELEAYLDHVKERYQHDQEIAKQRAEYEKKRAAYENASSTMNKANSEGEFRKAAETFAALGSFKNAEELYKQCLEKAEECQKVLEDVRSKFNDPNCSVNLILVMGGAAALCGDDSVKVFGWNPGSAFKRENIKAVAGNFYYIAELCTNGTVVVGKEDHSFKVADWQGITAINDEVGGLTGLRADGTAVAYDVLYRKKCDIDQWADVAYAVYDDAVGVFGVCKNGDVIYNGKYGDRWRYVTEAKNVARIKFLDYFSKRIVVFYADGSAELIKSGDKQAEAKWSDAVDVVSSSGTLLILQSDGNVFAYTLRGATAGPNMKINWTDIVSIGDTRSDYFVGLKSDGTVKAEYMGDDKFSEDKWQCDVSDWRNIIAVYSHCDLTVGVRADGSIVYCGEAKLTKSNPDWNLGWKLFDGVKDLEENIKRNKEFKASMERAAEEQREAIKRAAEEARLARIAELEKEKEALQAEIPTIKGLFAAGKIKKLQARVDEIETELTKLK